MNESNVIPPSPQITVQIRGTFIFIRVAWLCIVTYMSSVSLSVMLGSRVATIVTGVVVLALILVGLWAAEAKLKLDGAILSSTLPRRSIRVDKLAQARIQGRQTLMLTDAAGIRLGITVGSAYSKKSIRPLVLALLPYIKQDSVEKSAALVTKLEGLIGDQPGASSEPVNGAAA